MSVANHRAPFRPLRGGTQIFQPDNNEAGRIGCFLTSNGADRWLFTCLHVLSRSNGGVVATDRLVQPILANGVIATRANPNSRATARCVRPSTSTLCRTTCTRSILSILQPTPDPSIRQARHQALRSTFRAAFGLLSERRAHITRHVVATGLS